MASSPGEPMIPRKWTLRTQGQRLVFIRKNNESARHVIMKALLWALYLPTYPTLTVEIFIEDRYKPDLVAFDPQPNIYAPDKPLFWGESGVVSADKIAAIVKRYPDTHFAFGKWAMDLRPVQVMVEQALADARLKRSAPVDLLRFPVDSLTRFVDGEGTIRITHQDVEWRRLQP